MPTAPAFVDRVVEFYTLRRASDAQARLGAVRAEIADLSELGRQRASAAEALFAVGHTAEALRLALEALETLRDAADRYGAATGVARRPLGATEAATRAAEPAPRAPASAERAADAPTSAEPAAGAPTGAEPAADAPTGAEPAAGAPAGAEPTADAPASAEAPPAAEPDAPGPAELEPTWRAVLRGAAGVSAAALEATEAALARAALAEPPRLEADVTPAHASLFRDLMRARSTLLDALSPATLSRREIGFTRIWRPLVTAVLVLGGAYGLVQALRPVEGIFARASATWADSPDFQPERAIDGNEATMWLLPDAQTGFLEVRMVPARRVERVTLVNAGNASVADRGTSEYGLEIWVDGAVARSFDGEFAAPGARAEHEVGVDGVERIRFLVRGHHHLSGGLSELRWE